MESESNGMKTLLGNEYIKITLFEIEHQGCPKDWEKPSWNYALCLNTGVSSQSFRRIQDLCERGNSYTPIWKVSRKSNTLYQPLAPQVFMTSDTELIFFPLQMNLTCTFSTWGITKQLHGELIVLGRLKHIPLILLHGRRSCKESWELMHPFLPGLCPRMPSPLFPLIPTGNGASHTRNVDRSGFLWGFKHHHQRSWLQNWPKSEVGHIIISQFSQPTLDCTSPSLGHPESHFLWRTQVSK